MVLGDTCSNVPASSRINAWTADPHFCLIRLRGRDGRPPAGVSLRMGTYSWVVFGGQLTVLFDANGDGVSDASE